MRVDFVGAPAYTAAYCILGEGEGLVAERGSLAFLSAGIDIKPSLPGGIVRSVIRQRFGEETFVMSHFVATVEGAWVAVAPPYPGDIRSVEVAGDGLLVESGCLLAMSDSVEAKVRPSTFSNVLLHEGITMLHLEGEGETLFSSYGSIEEYTLEAGQELIVDTGYLVAWTPTLHVRVGPLGSIFTALATGEGLAAVFTGPGSLFLQTRKTHGNDKWTFPNREQNTGH